MNVCVRTGVLYGFNIKTLLSMPSTNITYRNANKFPVSQQGSIRGFRRKSFDRKTSLTAPLIYDVTVFVIAKIRVKSTHPTRRV